MTQPPARNAARLVTAARTLADVVEAASGTPLDPLHIDIIGAAVDRVLDELAFLTHNPPVVGTVYTAGSVQPLTGRIGTLLEDALADALIGGEAL